MSCSQYRLSTCSSPLMLSDRLLALAEVADRAGCAITAEHLVELAHSVFDDVAPARVPAKRVTGIGGFRPMDVPPAIFARLPVPLSGLAMQVAR